MSPIAGAAVDARSYPARPICFDCTAASQKAEMMTSQSPYVQFLEDSYGTAGSFKAGGATRFHSDPTGTEIEVYPLLLILEHLSIARNDEHRSVDAMRSSRRDEVVGRRVVTLARVVNQPEVNPD